MRSIPTLAGLLLAGALAADALAASGKLVLYTSQTKKDA